MDSKIYSLKLILNKFDSGNIQWKFYYSILWAVLSIFEQDKNIDIYKWILSISWLIKNQDDWFFIYISVLWTKNFNYIVNSIFNIKKEISLNNNLLTISWVDFNFKIFDLDSTEAFLDIKSIDLTFQSPTYIKKSLNNTDINFFLPIPEVFILSAVRRYFKLKDEFFDEKEYKDYIKTTFFTSRFDIKTKQITIKNNTKAWVIWTIKYAFVEKARNDVTFKNIIIALNLVNFIWLWTWTKLWLWQVKIFFNK